MNAINTLTALVPDTLIANPVGTPVVSSIKVHAEATKVWAVVGDFGGFGQFIPALASIDVIGSGAGAVRLKRFKEGGLVVVEQLNSREDDAMRMTWTTIYNNLGIANLWASMTVTPEDEDSSIATWSIIAEPALDNPANAEAFRAFVQSFADGAMANVPGLFKS